MLENSKKDTARSKLSRDDIDQREKQAKRYVREQQTYAEVLDAKLEAINIELEALKSKMKEPK